MTKQQTQPTMQRILNQSKELFKRSYKYPLVLFNYSWNKVLYFKQKYPKLFLYLSIGSFIALAFTTYILKKQDSFIYYPNVGFGKSCKLNPKILSHPKYRGGMQSDQIQITTKDNVILRGWHIKKQNSNKLFVYFQGNAGNMGIRLTFFEDFIRQTQSQILVIGYRGFSDSQGIPSQKGLQTDAQTILAKAIEISTQKKLKLYIFGQSIGGAVSIYAASRQAIRQKVSGMILQNTFTSTNDVITSMIPPLKYFSVLLRLINKNPWNSISYIDKVKCPILFIKSLQDRLIPPIMSDKLRQACNKIHLHTYMLQVPGADHNNVYGVDPVNYFTTINNFLRRT